MQRNRNILLHIAVLILFIGWGPSDAIAKSPLEVLKDHSIGTGQSVASAGSAIITDKKKDPGTVYLTTDELVTKSKDLAYMNLFKAELEKRGVKVQLSPDIWTSDDHVKAVKKCPKGAWVVAGCGGICAGTMRDMVLGKTGYLKTCYQQNQIKGYIILNLSPYVLKNLSFLKRAWDDNFSPSSFTGIPNPYDYCLKGGLFVAESEVDNKTLLGAKRVPVLADQIVAIMQGETTGTGSSSEGLSLRRVAEDDTSQDGDKVKELQIALQSCGYYQDCKIDGWFGPYTEEAVQAFQRDNGLEATGVVDQQLFDKIIAKGKEKSSPSAWGSGVGPEYLQASSRAQSNNAQIRSLANSLKGSTALQTAKNIFNWTLNNVRYQSYYNSQKGALGVLSSKRGNCCDQANLNVALLRAAGIPAKYGHGPDCIFGSGLRTGHVWCYAYIDGAWKALDTTSSKNSVGNLASFRAVGGIKYYPNVPF